MGAGLELIILDEVDSTNDEARRLLQRGLAPGFAVAAHRQTAGRGRLGRVWIAPPGNLSLTITSPWRSGRTDGSTVALLTGLAVKRAVAAVVGPRARVEVKWPNDVLIDGAKVSGSLIEVGEGVLYVGIGINVIRRPACVGYPTASLHGAIGRDVAVPELARAVIARWKPLFDEWQAKGFGPLRDDYNASLNSVGRSVRISLDRDKRAWTMGVCRGVDERGCLVLEGADGRLIPHVAGDVEPAWAIEGHAAMTP